MSKHYHRFAAFLLSAVMILSTAFGSASTVLAADAPPTMITNCEVTGYFPEILNLGFDDTTWTSAITSVTVNGTSFSKGSPSFGGSENLWETGTTYGSENYHALKIVNNNISYPATIVISADNYEDLTVNVTKNASVYPYVYTASIVGGETPTEPDEKPSYTVTVATTENGTVSVDKTSAKEGETVTVTTEPAENYTLDAISVADSTGASVSVSENAFTMPASNVTVSAAFKSTAPVTPSEDAKISLDQISVTSDWGDYNWLFTFGDAADYVSKITGVSVNGTAWKAQTYKPSSGGAYYPNTNDQQLIFCVDSYGTIPAIKDGDVLTITADGYQALTFKISIDDNGKLTVSEAGSTDPSTPTEPSKDKEITLAQVSVSQDFFGNDWYFTFANADDYVSKIKEITVNETVWEKKNNSVSSGGAYRANASENRLEFSVKDFSPSPVIGVLKSGDVITITADGYKQLTFKMVIDPNGKVSLVEDDGQGDPYKLHVKIEGDFEAALVGQKDYDGISGASTVASSNNNSNVTVYAALVEGDAEPTDDDWEELNNFSKINVVGSKCRVNIVPDTENGTDANSSSGMAGVYLPISSSLTLSGTPKDPGTYLISIDITDDQDRTATSNTLPFRIYTGDEKLADCLVLENLTQTQDGKYMWNIMEPWAIRDFGSNVDGEEESVRVPADVKAWYGSNTSGVYGYLGYDIAWKEVQKGNIPQTLYIPAGCDLTFVNMEILSSVKIVVENGGKLNLMDSTVQGIIEVKNGPRSL